MHELSIATSLIEVAGEALHGGGAVKTIHLRIGALGGVEADTLLVAFEQARVGTPFAVATLEIEAVPVAIFCDDCRAERELATVQSMRCPVCGGAGTNVRHGREMEIVCVELFDDDPDGGSAAVDPEEERPGRPRPAGTL